MSSGRNNTHCVLVELPFRSVNSPNIGLSLIKQSLRARGYACEIQYKNLEFVKIIGEDLYGTISERLPQEFLIGEIVFAPLVWDCDVNIQGIAGLKGARSENRATRIPEHIVQMMPELQKAARSFVRTVANQIIETGAAFVGLSTTFFRLPSLAMARALKKQIPSLTVILGGANCEGEMGPATLRNFPYVDFILQGEAELTMAELLDALREGNPLSSVDGLVWRSNNEIRANSRQHINRDLDSLPIPDYSDWFAQRLTYGLPLKTDKISLPLETSRGCWFGEKSHCIFCGLNGESLASRTKSPHRVLTELSELQRYGVSGIFATDLIFPHSYFKTLLPSLIKQNHGYSIFFETKSNLTRERLSQMAAAGINQLQPGIESLDSVTLKIMRKGVSAYQNLRLLKWCAELSINVFWNILVGIPGEPIESVVRTRELVNVISHLRPPVDGCVRVRVDRFSPLFASREDFGIVGLVPSRGYPLAYQLAEREIQALAYHFTPSTQLHSDEYEDAVSELMDAVHNWHQRAGSASLVLINHPDGTFVADRRSELCHIAELTALEAEVLRQAAGGVRRDCIRALADPVADSTIDRLLDLSILCEVDDLFLSLPTVFDESELISGLPVEESLSLAHVIHCERMRRFCAPYKLDLNACEGPGDDNEFERRSALC